MVSIKSLVKNASLKYAALDFARSNETTGQLSLTIQMLGIKVAYSVTTGSKTEMDTIESFTRELAKALRG